MNDKNFIASELRAAIQYYTDKTVDEQMAGSISNLADEAWADILNLINQLVEA